MPQYDVNSPDGKTWTVNAPDGATEQDAIAYVQKTHYSQAAPKASALSTKDKIVQGMIDPIEGGAQLLTKLLPDAVVKAGNSANNWISDNTGLVARLPEGGVDQQVKEKEAAYQASRAAQGESGIDWSRLGGNIISPANLALAAKMPVAATAGGRILAGGAGGALSGALNPVANDGDFATEKAKQIGLGAGFGAAIPAIAAGISRVISPNASVNPNVQLLKQEGVTPTVGQSLGGWANTAEEKLMSVPVLGDAIASARGRAREEFNNAAINRATAPIGQKIEGTGQQAVKEAGDAISAVYDKAKNALGAFRVDQQATKDLNNLRFMAQSLPKTERATVETYFKNYLNQPAMTAEAFKELDSKLAKDVARFAGSNDAYQQKVGEVLAQARTTITDSAKRANPQAAALFKQADEAWANLVRVEGASKAAKNAEGVFTPAQLNGAVKALDSSVRDRATARGTALMQDLSNAGQQVLGNKVPNSGTADRLMATALAGGAAYMSPATLAAILGGAAAYTRPLQGLLSGAVTARPQMAQPVAQALENASPYLVPLGAQVGTGFLH